MDASEDGRQGQAHTALQVAGIAAAGSAAALVARRARDARLERAAAPLRFRASYLVARDEVDDFVSAAQRLADAANEQLVRTGPWPPYSFAGEGASA